MNVVEVEGEAIIVELQVMLGILYLRLIRNNDASIAELSRASKGTANRLSCPAAFDFVEQHITAHLLL